MKDIKALQLKEDYPQLLLSVHLICPDLLLNEIMHFAASSACTYSKKRVVAAAALNADGAALYSTGWLQPARLALSIQ